MDNNPKRKILFGIDSATLTIPMHANIEVSDWLTSTEYYKTIKGTGETKEIKESPHETIRDNGISTRYQIHSAQFVKGQRQPTEVLRMTINAKQLKDRYPEGITSSNIKSVYEYIISQGHVNLPFYDFVRGTLTDCDFKADFYLDSLDEVKATINALHNRTNPKLTTQGSDVFHPYKQVDNYGLEYYKRRKHKGSLAPRKQNTRVYSKGLEMEFKSREFREAFIAPDLDLMPILRLETNGVKNSKSARNHYNIEDTSLKNLLSLTLDDCRDMFTKPFSHFLVSDYKKPKSKSISFNDYFMASAMEEMMRKSDHNQLDLLWAEFQHRYQNDVREFKTKQEKSKIKRIWMDKYHQVFNAESYGEIEGQNELAESIQKFLKLSF
jgi:hypothetical protein